MDPQVKFESIQREAITKNALKEQVKRIKKELDMLNNEAHKQVVASKKGNAPEIPVPPSIVATI